MHIGNFIESELNKNRYSIAEVAKELSKSETAVRKDLKKDKLHMDVVEGYSRVLKINLYSLLANEMEGKDYRRAEPPSDQVNEEKKSYSRKGKNSSDPIEQISLTFNVSSDKKEALLKLLTS